MSIDFIEGLLYIEGNEVFVIPSGGSSIANTPRSYDLSIAGSANASKFTWIGNASTQSGVFFTSIVGEPNLVSWGSGTWTIRLHITSGHSDITWTSVHVCRLNSAGTTIEEVVGSNLSVNLAAGVAKGTVLSTTVTASATIAAAASDRVHVVLAFTNVNSSRNRRLGIGSEEIITTPLELAGTGDTIVADTAQATGDVLAATIEADVIINALTIPISAAVLAATVEAPIQVNAATATATGDVPAATVFIDTVVLATTITATATVLAATAQGGAGVLKMFDGQNYIVLGGTG